MTLCDPSRFNQRNTSNAVSLALVLVREDWYTYHRDGRITRISYTRAPDVLESLINRKPPRKDAP